MSSGFPAGHRTDQNSDLLPAKARLVAVLVVLCALRHLLRVLFVVCVSQLQARGLQVRREHRKIDVTSSCHPRLYFHAALRVSRPSSRSELQLLFITHHPCADLLALCSSLISSPHARLHFDFSLYFSTLALEMNREEEIALPASAVISWSDLKN